jgi:hypothetical protein
MRFYIRLLEPHLCISDTCACAELLLIFGDDPISQAATVVG